MCNLSKPYQVRLSEDQDKALIVLKSKGVNPSKFVRQAIQEKLLKDFRLILKEIQLKEIEKYCPFSNNTIQL